MVVEIDLKIETFLHATAPLIPKKKDDVHVTCVQNGFGV